MALNQDREAASEETRRIRRLQRVVAVAQQMLATQVRTRGEALVLIEGVREYALKLFPEKGGTFDLIYGPRLERICRERFGRVDAGGEGEGEEG